MKTLICYSDKSSVTGKAIREKFNALRKRTDKKSKCDLFIRWGSTEVFTNTKFKLELNTLEAVNRTINKHEMLKALSAAGVPTPTFNSTVEDAAKYMDAAGMQYIRNNWGVVRYSNDFNPQRDAYYTKPVQFKRREYRVHVFNGKVLGIYEKVPFEQDQTKRPKLFKSDTCNFVRCDMEVCRLTKDNQQTCIDSVTSLGLLFGGVDVIRDRTGNIFICEVNSAPGLNNLNIDRWVEEINKYVDSNTTT